MRKLLDFLYKHRTTGLFLLLQVICIWMIFSSDRFYNAAFFNSSNAVSGSVSLMSQNTVTYFELGEENQRLAQENAYLRQLLSKAAYDYFTHSEIDTVRSQFEIITGKVINKTYRRSRNYLTLAVGKRDGVQAGMAVVSGQGVVGRVRASSDNFSTITSILNPNIMISGQVKSSGTLCTAQWDRRDYRYVTINFIPRHIPLVKGDTVFTSGFNAVFPPDVMIGVIDSVSLTDENPFYWARAELGVDMATLDYAYIVKQELAPEIDSLQSAAIEEL
ncbi:MAG: rod shape-determining protein MreC [Bacteroidota bacterium]